MRDRALPGLATVLDTAAAAALVARLLPDAPRGTPQLTYTRYKPGASCLVALRYDDGEATAYVTLKAVGRDAHEKWAKYRGSRRVTADDAERIAIRRFPHDGELDGPRWLFDAARREQVLAALDLHADTVFDVITYKPERRVVVRAMVHGKPQAVVKCYDAAGFVNALAAHQALARLPHLPVSPATAWHEKRGVIASPWIAGRMLDVATDDLAHFKAAGAALAAVHDAAMDVRAGEAGADARLGLHRIAQAVEGWSPAAREPLRQLLNRLAHHRDEGAPAAVPIHGDFYTKQLLLGDHGVSLLDFDECALDDPHIDLAIFAAHLERDVLRRAYPRERASAVLDALLAGYRLTRPVDLRRLTWRTAEALVRLAPHPFRHRDPDWPALTERLVQRAQAVLDGIPSTVHARPSGRVTPTASHAARAWSHLAADRALAFAASLACPDVMTRVLSERRFSVALQPVEVQATTLVRHKPGRRCMVAIDLRGDGAPERWLGKVRARGTDSRAALVHSMLWDAGARAFIPEPLGVVDAMRMTLQRAVSGVSLDAALASGEDAAALGELVARTLADFHALRLDPGRTWTLDDERTILRTRLASLGESHPDIRPQLAVLGRQLVEVAAPLASRATSTVVHRDLYHDQVLVHDDRCVLVDLDLVALGDPALDAGNLVGHLVELQWRSGIDARVVAEFTTSFCSAVISRSGGTITEDAITRYALLTLGRMLEIASQHAARASFVASQLGLLSGRLARAVGPLELSLLMEVPTWLAA